MVETRNSAIDRLYDVLQSYERLYQFRDPNNACLFDLRVNECYALQLIVERGPLSVAELADALGVHKSNASRIARALENKKFIRTTADNNDKRTVLWNASSQGKKQYNTVKQYLVDRFSNTLKGYKVEDLSKISEAIKRLAEDAEERMTDQCG